ncbi:MerR family DNA-binding protein [Nocardia pneumoniae]|uniref:MerR family DNA-binding protein n=1 Tax=Nocardia pneumoniae TaxID=228601 RepID=UPI0002F830F0|nr:MerR family DNA-binding protein [Nocardia pneumoniae]
MTLTVWPDEVAELLTATQVGRRRTDGGLQARAAAKLAEIDAELAELTSVRDTLRAALAAGCDDLIGLQRKPLLPSTIQHRRCRRRLWPLRTPWHGAGGR